VRIIAGEFRGRKLLAPISDATRPITDRAKQSLFDILSPLIPDSVVYDCFSGTGSMGLECLSRGAGFATFFEQDRTALQQLKQNIESLHVADRCRVIGGDLFRWFDAKAAESASAGVASIVFLDPPYRMLNTDVAKLQSLAMRLGSHLAPEGIVVFRHDAADHLELPGLVRYDQRDYGSMAIELLRKSHG
jgi:16S rRNA (guanine966-N2)-methyltransferase